MEIIKRKSGNSYREKVCLLNKKVVSKCFKRKTDARIWKQDLEAKLRSGDNVMLNTETYSFESIARDWFILKMDGSKSIRTKESYLSYVENKFIPYFKDKDINSISTKDALEFQSHLAKSGHNPKGVNLLIGCLRQIFKYAVDIDTISKSPFDRIPNLKKGQKLFEYLTDTEIRTLLKVSVNSEYYPAYFTAIYTGLRRGELAALKWDRVDFVKNRIDVTRTRDRYGLRENTKSNKLRVVPIATELRPLLLGLSNRRSSDFVFTYKSGVELNFNHISRELKKSLKLAGINRNIRFHDLRHTFASQYMMKGGSIYTLQKLLGHSSIQMTEIYAHLSKDHLSDAIEVMSFYEGKENVLSIFQAHN